MSDREQAVIALLRMRHDWIRVRTWTGSLVQRAAVRGEVKHRWVECPRCGGRKMLGKGRAERPCDLCDAEGRVRVDPYIEGKSRQALERERVTGEAESAKLRRQRDARELRRLEVQARHRRGEIDAREKEAWEAAKDALYALGSFSELDKALKALRRVSEYDYAAVTVVYGVDAPLRTVGPELQKAADVAVGKLARLMPATIRVPVVEVPKGRWAHGTVKGRASRDDEIRRLAQSLSQAEIARRLGVDRSTVSRVLGKARMVA